MIKEDIIILKNYLDKTKHIFPLECAINIGNISQEFSSIQESFKVVDEQFFDEQSPYYYYNSTNDLIIPVKLDDGTYCNSENIESVTDKNQYFINKNINTQLKVHPDRLKEYAELKDLILKEQLLSIPKIYKFKESVIRDSLQKCYDKKYSEIVDILPDFFSFLYKHNYIQID
jgi:hypothetical protein